MSYIGFDGYVPSEIGLVHAGRVREAAAKKEHPGIVNPCFTGDTLVHTKGGHRRIDCLVGEEVEVWNGDEWITVDSFRVTARDQRVYTITMHDGSVVTATEYHRFLLANGSTVELKDLVEGDELAASDAPLTFGDAYEPGAYLKGFCLGDGTLKRVSDPLLWIYAPKFGCSDRLLESAAEVGGNAYVRDVDSKRWTMSGMDNSLSPWCGPYRAGLPGRAFMWNKETILEFLAGLFDADGTAMDTKHGFGYQLSSVSLTMLRDVQQLLKIVGVRSKIQNGPSKYAGFKDFGQTRGGVYQTKDLYRLTVSQAPSIAFAKQAVFTRLSSFHDRSCSYTVKDRSRKIYSIEPAGIESEVYCCTITQGDDVFSLSCGIRTRQCGEIPLSITGGFCLIGDIVPYFAAKDRGVGGVVQAGIQVARALIRTNLMQTFYRKEVLRSNRIGVSMTGIHEWAWNSYGLDFKELIGDTAKAQAFWADVEYIASEIVLASDKYSDELGLNHPETVLTIKPAGSVSKLFALTEGAHLPSRLFYIRWVQFRNGDPLIEYYKSQGYPTKELRTYSGTTIVGFPTTLELARIMPVERIVTAAQATPEEQFRWVKLLERHWLTPDGQERGGQVSYTLKYDQEKVSQAQLAKVMRQYMPGIKAISIMPLEAKTDDSSYEYLPEQTVTKEEYDAVVSQIRSGAHEDVDAVHIGCDTGACPLEMMNK